MEIGTTYGSHRVDGKLGEGGMADVFKVWNTGLHRYEALKAPKSHFAHDPTFVSRFLTEARTAASLQHPHIATIYTVSDTQASQPFFTMELVDGGDLADLLRQRGHLELPEVTNLLRQIAAALDHAHSRGIIHRDIKPANVLLQSDGNGNGAVKVVDFGIARAQEAGGARLTKTGMIVGTPEYMSPEQGGSGAKVDHRTDIYSLGVMAYEMLCGQPPFSAGPEGSAITVIMSHIREQPRPPLQSVPGLPMPVNNAILKALSKDPTDRFLSCAELITALTGNVAVNVPVNPSLLATPAGVVPSAKPPLRTAPIAIGVVAVLGLALVAIGLGHSLGTPQPGALVPIPAATVLGSSSGTPSITPSAPVSHKVKVPDVSGMTEKQAREALTDKKLRMELTTGESATTSAGHVISQGPDADTLLDPTDTVRVRISMGSPAVTAHSVSSYSPSQPNYSRPIADASEAHSGIVQTISNWKSAWENLNISNYMSTYASDARILSNKRWYSYSQYYSHEADKFGEGGRIQLYVGTPEITVSGDAATATFDNTFQRFGGKGDYHSSGVETLKLRNIGGRWLIYEDIFRK